MKKRIVLLFAAVTAVVFLFAGCSDKEIGDKLTIGVAGEYYPFCYTEDDNLQGFEIDMWNEIGKRGGYEIDFKVADFTGLFGMLDSGKVDSVGHGVAINDERAEKYQFSNPYIRSSYNVVTVKDSGYTRIEDFEGKKIGVVMGGEGERNLKKLCEEQGLDIEIVGYEGSAAMDEDVQLGRIDARLAPKIQTSANIAKNDLNLEITDIVIYTETDAYPFPRKEKYDDLKLEVNKILGEMREDGTLKDLSEKWFNLDATN